MALTKKKKIIIIVTSSVVGSIALAVAIPFMVLGIRTASLKSSYSYLKSDSNYSTKVEISNIELVKQHVSCGYATIEMMSNYYGDKVTEDDLDTKNKGAVSTSSSKGFLNEINKSISNKKFIERSYLKNDVLLKEIHNSLSKDNPVALEWAAKDENGTWTLHFSLVSGLDLSNDNVTVYNPYGYIENINISEFISRTTFSAFKNMPMLYGFGFAYGAFDKNTIFYVK